MTSLGSASLRAAFGRLRLLVPFVALAATACLPSPGPFVLDAVEGRVVDRDTGVAIAGAEVFEWHRGAGRGGGPQPVYVARWTTSDDEGSFAFPRAWSTSPRMWLLRTYDPTYSFYHPAYGLEHARGPREGEPLVIEASTSVAEQRMQNLDPVCRGERDDAGSRHLAEIACPDRPSR